MRKRSLQASRPSIPVPCMLALACVVGVYGSGVVVSWIEPSFVRIVLAGGFVSASILFAVAVVRRGVLVWWIAAFLIVGLLLGMLQLLFLEQERSQVSHQGESFAFSLCEDARASTFGSQMVAVIDEGPQAGTRVLLFTDEKVSFLTGERILAETRLDVPGEDYRSYYDQRNIAFSVDLGSYEHEGNATWLSGLYQLRERLLNIIGTGSDEQTLLRAILLGERSALFDAGFYQDIKVAGLAHLVAVSGAHLVIVTGFITLLLRHLRLSAKLSVAAQTLFLVAYLILVGFPISCIRAALMSGITLFALLAKRRSSSLTALGITVLLMVAFDPSVVYQLSFQLSVCATLGIVVFMPLVNEWFAALIPKMPEFIRESISMTLAALIFSLPLSAARFSMLPLISPLANIVATPYLSLLLMAGFSALLVCSVVPGALALLSLITRGLIAFFAGIGSLPFASVPVSTTLSVALPLALSLAILLWLWWPTPRRQRRIGITCVCGVLIVLVVFALGLRVVPAGDKIVMLDVGQGDSFALMSEGKTILIDTGNEQEMLYAALARNNINKVDAALITHPDDDHCGNLLALQGVVEVGQVLVAEGLDEVDDDKAKEFLAQARRVVGGDRIVEVRRGDELQVGIFTLDIVSPEHVEHEGGNEDSICFYARADCDRDGKADWNALFCGDAETEVLEELQDHQLLEAVDIYKVGHHGSRKALTPELAARLAPKMSLIGVGKNSYGHPNEETLACLEQVGSRIYRSDECGDVVCRLALGSLEVSTQRTRG